jgi:hypothetical protein
MGGYDKPYFFLDGLVIFCGSGHPIFDRSWTGIPFYCFGLDFSRKIAIGGVVFHLNQGYDSPDLQA